MEKKIPVAELKTAITALNEILETGKIKTVAQKADAMALAFKAKVEEFIEEDTAETLPDEVVDFYNTYFADGDEEEKEEKPAAKKTAGAAKGSAKPSVSKTAAAPKTGAKVLPKAGAKPAATSESEKKKAVVPAKKAEKSHGRKKSENAREISIVKALKKGGTIDKLASIADAIYVESGGKSNVDQSKKLVDRGLKYLGAAGILKNDNGVFSI